MTTQVIKNKTSNESLSYLGLSKEYFEAAISLNKSGGFQNPTIFLACHSLELSLKSILIFYGENECSLRNIGHDLSKSISKVELITNKSILIEEHKKSVLLVSKVYLAKELEYFFQKPKEIGISEHIFSAAKSCIDFASDLFISDYFKSQS